MESFSKNCVGSVNHPCGSRNLISESARKSKRKKMVTTVKGTFGHARSRDEDGKLFSLDRTLSESSSDIRFQDIPATATAEGTDEMEVFEPNSESSSGVPQNLLTERLLAESSSCEERIGSCGNQNCHQHHFQYLDEDDEFSSTELPSGLVDVEGNIIDSANVRFENEDDDENDLNEDDDELSSLPDELQLSSFNYKHPASSSTAKASQSFSRSSRGRGSFEDLTCNPQKSSSGKMGKQKEKSVKLPDFRNPHQFNEFVQLRSHRGKASNNNNNSVLKLRNGERRKSLSMSSCSNSTITQHYYPEGGWGYFILVMAFLSQALLCGIHLSSGIVVWGIVKSFNGNLQVVTLQDAVWLAVLSFGVSLFLSPIWVSICKRKSTRLSAVFGGLVASLGCLFTSFASQFHQLFLSYGAFIGIGVGITRDASSLMVGQYFKRKRDLVEVIVVSASGLGILIMSVSIHTAISALGWRLGLQAITVALSLTFFFGTCYRSASLYHPQRRAILHLKDQKRKVCAAVVKEKEKLDDHLPFLDFGCLRSKTLQILLLSCAFTAFGINTPLFYLAIERDKEVTLDSSDSIIPSEFSLVILHVGIGISWIVGCFLFGLIVIQKNQECRVSKQYLCQIAGVISGISILALATTEGFNGLVIFSCIYGFSLGGYNYVLKVYTYERVRARHFPRAWSFIQSSQAIPLALGVPLAGYLNTRVGWKSGYYMSAISVIIGAAFLFLTDVRKRRLSKRKTKSGSIKTLDTSESVQTPKPGRLSFSFPVDQFSPLSNTKHEIKTADEVEEGQCLDPALLAQELTCISEEGIPGMRFQDMYFEDWADYLGGDCITSCNKVENCLVSEFDPEHPVMLDRRSRRWSAAKSNLIIQAGGIGAAAVAVAGGIIGLGTVGQNPQPPEEEIGNVEAEAEPLNYPTFPNHRIRMIAPREIPIFRSQSRKGLGLVPPARPITVIDEAEASV